MPRERALKAIAETVRTGSFELNLVLIDSGAEVQAEISCAFDHERLWFKRRYRSRVEPDRKFSNWLGPDIVVLPDTKTALSRVLEYENSTSKQLRDRVDVDLSLRLFWPQFVGTSISGVWLMPDESPRGFLEDSSFTEVRSERDFLDGAVATKVEYSSPDRANMQVWYVDDCNGLIGKMAIATEAGGTGFVYQVLSDLKEWEPGVWFPERIVTERHVGGDSAMQEIVNITSFTTQPPDEKTFGLDGVELERDGILRDVTRNDQQFYRRTATGLERLSPQDVSTVFPYVETRDPLPRDGSKMWWFVMIAIAVNVTGILFYLGYRRRTGK